MKRVKIMFLSFALLAGVGGVLAFKVTYGPVEFCYTTTTEGTPLPTCSMISALPIEFGFVIYSTPSVFLNGVDQCEFDWDGTTRLTCKTQIKVLPN